MISGVAPSGSVLRVSIFLFKRTAQKGEQECLCGSPRFVGSDFGKRPGGFGEGFPADVSVAVARRDAFQAGSKARKTSTVSTERFVTDASSPRVSRAQKSEVNARPTRGDCVQALGSAEKALARS